MIQFLYYPTTYPNFNNELLQLARANASRYAVFTKPAVIQTVFSPSRVEKASRCFSFSARQADDSKAISSRETER